MSNLVDIEYSAFTAAALDGGVAMKVWADGNEYSSATVGVASGNIVLILDGTTSTITASANTTMGAFVDAVNALTGIDGVLVGALRSDGTTSALLTLSATNILTADGVELNQDSSATVAGTNGVVMGLGISLASPKEPDLRRIRQYVSGQSVDTGGKALPAPGELNEIRKSVVKYNGTASSSAVTLEIHSRDDENNTAYLITSISHAASATLTSYATSFLGSTTDNYALPARRGQWLVARVIADGASLSGVSSIALSLFGRSIPQGLTPMR